MAVKKFRKKYRIPSSRAPFWEYGWSAAYIVTICTVDKHCYFGRVAGDTVILSQIGKIVKNEWNKTFDLRPDMNLTQGDYIIMPNHFHAIINMGENKFNSSDTTPCVSKFAPQSKNLSSIIRGFKTSVTRSARSINPDFSWQPRFHDHIIRDDVSSYQTISEYIITNPSRWLNDKFHPSRP